MFNTTKQNLVNTTTDSTGRQFGNDFNSLVGSFLATFVVSLGLQTTRLYMEREPAAGNTLEDDPMCGVTTGGMKECIWDCERFNINLKVNPIETDIGVVPSFAVGSAPPSVLSEALFKDPICMDDCFEESHCVSKLFADYRKAGGICKGAYVIPGEMYQTVEEGVCQVIPGPVETSSIILQGICSEETEAALSEGSCIRDVASRDYNFWFMNWRLINLTCRIQVVQAWYDFQGWFAGFPDRFSKAKLNPILGVLNQPVFGEVAAWVPKFDNTRHRYPWVCSLRRKNRERTHMCAVILLKRPPGPIVLVTTAHCTLLCKSEDGKVLPNCCCENVSGKECPETVLCGTNPSVRQMTSEDVEVICGEWETGDAPKEASGEKYNIIFQIKVGSIVPFQLNTYKI